MSVEASPSRAEERTLRVELTFDGTNFEGWQRQETGRTVQGEVEAALARILGAPHAVVGCGRTDAGVHARHYVASFRTRHAMAPGDLGRALDAVLPEDVGVLAACEAPAAFHARRSAAWKWYRYTILVSRRKHPLIARHVLRLGVTPALQALGEAAGPLVGRHDFQSFANTGSSPKHTVRTVYRLVWSEAEQQMPPGRILHLDVVGDGFLYKMVRTLVGSMLQAARAAEPAATSQRILAARSREAAGPAVPALGLTLMAVAVRDEPAPGWAPENLLPDVESTIHRGIGGST